MSRVNAANTKQGVKRNCGLAAVVVFVLLADAGESSPDDRPATVLDTPREPEEVIVTALPPKQGAFPTAEFMQQVYDARSLGSCLYAKGRYEEAFPYLRAAARKGFKMAQARLGYLYQQGLGVDRDTHTAMAWYGVAASGTTLPVIRNYFKDALRSVPEEHRPSVDAVVDEYRDRYAARHNRVVCDLNARAGTFLKTLTCRFQDDAFLVDHGRMADSLSRENSMYDGPAPRGAINPVEEDGIRDNPYPMSMPLRAKAFGC
ncbi:MAG: sel1 repeat family protein [Gammaproteobacteria bacterium]|nr:sel1 repeat family protein [Gammaproteobacteria bacterium]MYJ74650.1 sel1 repeat family protein [Gammaproteobacteria bacterium]